MPSVRIIALANHVDSDSWEGTEGNRERECHHTVQDE